MYTTTKVILKNPDLELEKEFYNTEYTPTDIDSLFNEYIRYCITHNNFEVELNTYLPITESIFPAYEYKYEIFGKTSEIKSNSTLTAMFADFIESQKEIRRIVLEPINSGSKYSFSLTATFKELLHKYDYDYIKLISENYSKKKTEHILLDAQKKGIKATIKGIEISEKGIKISMAVLFITLFTSGISIYYCKYPHFRTA